MNTGPGVLVPPTLDLVASAVDLHVDLSKKWGWRGGVGRFMYLVSR